MQIGAVIPAAGAGRRFGSRAGKLFERVAGQPLLVHALAALHGVPAIRAIVVVARERDHHAIRRLIEHRRLTRVVAVVSGGATRAESVRRGIAALPASMSWVLIHDGARPYVPARVLQAVIAQAARSGAAVCGMPASLTVKSVDAQGAVRLTLDRDHLWLIQTPQVFRRAWWDEAIARVNGQLGQFPDDAALLEWAGFPVQVVPGDPWNIKVTTREDLILAEMILHRQGVRSRKTS